MNTRPQDRKLHRAQKIPISRGSRGGAAPGSGGRLRGGESSLPIIYASVAVNYVRRACTSSSGWKNVKM
jgi:hypothetical protein